MSSFSQNQSSRASKSLKERGYHMTDLDLRTKKALLLLEASEQAEVLKIVESDYHALIVELEGLICLMKERRRDISIEAYEVMFSPNGAFRKTLEDFAKASDENARLAEATANF